MASVYFDPAVGGDGSTVTDDSNPTTGLANGGHRARFVPALAQMIGVGNFVLTKAGEAAADAADAQAWATQLGTPVSGGEYSAKYHAQAAASSASSASSAAGAAISSLDAFDDRYLGDKAGDPATDNDGNALLTGAMYWRTTSPAGLKIWDGSAWVAAALSSVSASGIGVTPSGPLTDTDVQSALSTLAEGSLVFQGRSARASNTALGASDCGKLIDITSGTFTQTFVAATTLGGNWYCTVRNSGTGDITLDPNGSELIDGLTSYVMYPGEARLIMCDGTGFYSLVKASFYKVFTATGSFVKPPGYNRMQGLAWGAGGGGSGGYGGNGGSCVPFDLPASDFAASQTFTIGAGGAAGADGGATTWLTYTTGSAGKGNTYGTYGYGRDYVTGPLAPNRIGGAYNFPQPIYADYGGGRGLNTAGALAALCHSIFGGAGGVVSGSPGTSVFGGQGGVGAGNGTAPGGGGGSTGAGARGEIRIWGVI